MIGAQVYEGICRIVCRMKAMTMSKERLTAVSLTHHAAADPATVTMKKGGALLGTSASVVLCLTSAKLRSTMSWLAGERITVSAGGPWMSSTASSAVVTLVLPPRRLVDPLAAVQPAVQP